MKENAKKLWNYDCPTYDNRSGMAVNAGWDHGVGKTQPVGSHEHRASGPIKYGRTHTLRDDVKG